MTALAVHDRLRRAGRGAAVAGVVGSAVTAMAAIFAVERFLEGYLFAFIFWIGLPLGAAAISLGHRLTGGAWGRAIRGPLQGALMTLPLFIVLLAPLLLGVHHLYPWTVMGAGDPTLPLPGKSVYLSTWCFRLRALAYVASWAWIMVMLVRRRAADGDGQARAGWAGGALVLHVLTVTFAMIDWVATLEPHWYSSIYGLYVIMGQLLLALTAMTIGLILLGPDDADRAERLHDLGKLLLTLVILHAYMAFSQFFIIWSGNLPHEISWYLLRTRAGWGVLAVVIVVVHFLLPFAALLARNVKRRPRALLAVACVILAARLLDMAWMVLPSFHSLRPMTLLAAASALVGIGGFCVAITLWQWRVRLAHVEIAP